MHITDIKMNRRTVLKGAAALVITVATPGNITRAMAATTASKRSLLPTQVDTYLAINEDGLVTAYFGKIDMGQAVDVSIAQIVADELDVEAEQVKVVMGDTALTVNQGGASGSIALEWGARPLRIAAAEARKILIDLASEKLAIPPQQLVTNSGSVLAQNNPGKRVSYGELIKGKNFNVTLEWNGHYGNRLNVSGSTPLKAHTEYKVVGKPFPRRDLPDIVLGKHQYIVDVKVPGMLHGRVIRPPAAGSVPVKVDVNSIRSIRGARVVHVDDFLGVVAEQEWNAVQAARQLKIEWSKTDEQLPESENLYEYIRQAPVVKESAGSYRGPHIPVDRMASTAAFANADRIIEAEYEFPFQSHACMGPACAVCDYRGDSATVWTASQKPHDTAAGVANLLGLAVEDVHGIWVPGTGSFGRNDAGDVSIEAALMSKAVGRPVRVQNMRYDGHAWDPKGTASVHHVKAGFNKSGKVIAYEFHSKGFSLHEVASNESNPSDTYAGMLTGWPSAHKYLFSNPEDRYKFPNKLQYWQIIAPLQKRASPLRTSSLRDPLGPQLHFASESFIDEIATVMDADPIEFRLRYLHEERDAAVLKAVAERYGWQARTAGPSGKITGRIARGRGVAYTRRINTVIAVIVDVEVNLDNGHVWPRKFTVAADHGIVVNPLWLRRTIEGNIIHATSRCLFEEVQFSQNKVTSVDWISYPILEMEDAPEEIDIVLLNHPELPPHGAGEPSTRTVFPAIANAIFDATGARIRRIPFTTERVKKALEYLQS